MCHFSSSASSEKEEEEESRQMDSKKHSGDADSEEEPPAPQPSVRADEIPPVPSNRFLMRNTQPERRPERETKEPDRTGRTSRDTSRDSSYYSRHSDRYYDYGYRRGYHGKEVKGRGSLRYHDSRRSRSNTPPHWKEEQSKLKSLELALSETKHHDSDLEEGQISDSEEQT